jgi:tetratricopeptide (TPR) repeat protein
MSPEQLELEASLQNSSTPIERVNAQNALAEYLRLIDLERSLTLAQTAEKLAQSEGYSAGLARALRAQARDYRMMGDHGNALQLATNALREFEVLEDQQQQGLTLQIIGAIYLDLGDYGRSLMMHLSALAKLESSGDLLNRAVSLVQIGMVSSSNGDSAQAIRYYQQAIEQYAALGENQRQAVAYNSCCVDYSRLGNYEQAQQYGEKAEQLFTQAGDSYGTAVARSSLGEVALACQDYTRAVASFEQALSLFQQWNRESTYEVVETRLNLGRSYYHLKQYDQAAIQAQKALDNAVAQKMQSIAMQAHYLLAQIREQESDLVAALTHLKRYSELREGLVNQSNQRDIRNLQIIHETQQALAESERQKKLREMDRQQYERLAQIKDEFLNHATHDIKNPLSVIHLSLFMLESLLLPDQEKARDYLNRIRDAGDKIKQL